MEGLIGLIIVSLIGAVLLLVIKPGANKIRWVIVSIAGGLVCIGSIAVAIYFYFKIKNIEGFFPGEGSFSFLGLKLNGEVLTEYTAYLMLALEVVIAAVIFALGIKYKNAIACILSVVSIGLAIYFEFWVSHPKKLVAENNLYLDNLSVIMILIIGIIGVLICVYAVPYMKDFASHLKQGEADRRPVFFALLFLFLAAMFGIVTSNNMQFMLFFWEITTLCSFLLIGYTKTDEAIKNSFRAVNMNLIGGIAFSVAVIIIGKQLGTISLDEFIDFAVESKTQGMNPWITMSLILLGIAGISKAAQIPFSTWLLGAMVAPTPTSALLHSSTMVKAGVFLIIKLSPALGLTSWLDFTSPGFFVAMVGAITFLIASFQAITQSNAKRVLAYSTVANLGLIVMLAGIGSPGTIWAAIFLLIFHAVTKSLLFLCVGTTEHNIGSRDIEDMDGMFSKYPKLALCMIIGISGMYLAPFGMLISKWTALEQVILVGNPLLVFIIAFGSAVTLFYWSKWLGKMIAVVSGMNYENDKVNKAEMTLLGTIAFLVALVVMVFPLISKYFVEPYLIRVFDLESISTVFTAETMTVTIVLLVLIIIIPLIFYGKTKKVIKNIYLAGAGKGDDLSYTGTFDKKVNFSLKNWYMQETFNERKLEKIGYIATGILIGLVFIISFTSIFAYDDVMNAYLQQMGGLE